MRWAFVAALLVLMSHSALGHDERQIRRDCRSDALSYCKAAIMTASRQTIIECMLKNRDKLQEKCSRHLY